MHVFALLFKSDPTQKKVSGRDYHAHEVPVSDLPEDEEDRRRDTGVAAVAADKAATAAAPCSRWSSRPPAAITALSAGLAISAAGGRLFCGFWREFSDMDGRWRLLVSGGDFSWPYCHSSTR